MKTDRQQLIFTISKQISFIILPLIICITAATLVRADETPASSPQSLAAGHKPLNTPRDMINYSIGVEVIKNFKKSGMEMDIDLVIQGMRDAAKGEKLIISDKDIRKSMNAFQAELRKKQAETNRKESEENKKKGATFLEENKKKDGVTVLPNGVQYSVLKTGTGKKPADIDVIVCNYRGTLVDGAEFDSSDTGQPATLKLNQLILGWRETLKLMPVGSRWLIVVPSQLAYGQRGAGSIGPNETLIFDVELLAIK